MFPQYSDFVGGSAVESWSRRVRGEFEKVFPR